MMFKGKDAEHAITKAKMVTLLEAFATHTDCQAVQVSGLDITRKTYETPATGLVDRKGILVAQEADGTIHKWALPGILASDCEKLPNSDGEKIKAEVAATLIAAIATATGYTLTPCECFVVQSR